MSTSPSPSSEPTPSDGAVWGWWPSFEHYSSPGSTPWGTSASRTRVEAAIDRHDGRPNKVCTIAHLASTGWVLDAKRIRGNTEKMKSSQADKYIKARAGGGRGNLGEVPPAHELTRPTVDLDR